MLTSAAVDVGALQVQWAVKIQFFIHSFLVTHWNSVPEVPMSLQSFYYLCSWSHGGFSLFNISKKEFTK